jgi:hypothetical protein
VGAVTGAKPKIGALKLPTSEAKPVTYDEEFKVDNNSRVNVTFAFPNGKRLDLPFDAGDTTLAMKKRLFDLFQVRTLFVCWRATLLMQLNYDTLKLTHGDVVLLGESVAALVHFC